MRTERGLSLVAFWFLVFGAVMLLVALDTVTRSFSLAAPQLRQVTAAAAGLAGLVCLVAGAGLWLRRPWARWLGLAACGVLALAHLNVMPALVALDALVAWFLWRRETTGALAHRDHHADKAP